MLLRIACADGTERILVYDTDARTVVTTMTTAASAPGLLFANAREHLAYNRAGRRGGALDFAEITALARGATERPDGFLVRNEDDPAYVEWRIEAWPDDLRANSAVAAPDPWAHARIGTAVAVVRDGAILLGKRISSYGNGAWQTPGGKPDPGERLAVAAARELEEESGLVALDTRYATSQVDTMPETGVTWRTHFWVARVEGEPWNREPEKCAGWAWFALDALPEPLFAIEPRTIETIARIATVARRK